VVISGGQECPVAGNIDRHVIEPARDTRIHRDRLYQPQGPGVLRYAHSRQRETE